VARVVTTACTSIARVNSPIWLRGLLLLLRVLLVAAAAFAVACDGRETRGVASQAVSGEIAQADLPQGARDTLALIRHGGPFPFRKDGAVFANREARLPPRAHGYYREYTVPTPGSRDRGARRIVAGRGSTGDPATSNEYYYSDDHYESFRRIRE
jgi:ribonuclease T1